MTSRGVQTQLTEERKRVERAVSTLLHDGEFQAAAARVVLNEYGALADAYLAQQKEHPTVAEFRIDGARCALCGGGAYPPWLTDDETWRKVMGDSHEQVCLPCFNDRVRTGGPLRVSVGSPETRPE